MLAISLMYMIEVYNKQVLGNKQLSLKGRTMTLHNGRDVSMVNLTGQPDLNHNLHLPSIKSPGDLIFLSISFLVLGRVQAQFTSCL